MEEKKETRVCKDCGGLRAHHYIHECGGVIDIDCFCACKRCSCEECKADIKTRYGERDEGMEGGSHESEF
jgi:hypothetical protein